MGERLGTSDWLNTMKVVDLYNRTDVDGAVNNVQRPKSQPHPGTRRIKSDLADNYIPEKHPNLNRFRVPDSLKGATDAAAGGGDVAKNEERDKQIAVEGGEKIIGLPATDKDLRKDLREVLLNTTRKPFNNINKYSKLEELDKLEAAMDFKGTYTDVFRSEHEKRIHEYTEAKKKFVGPPFKTHFGKASQLPLRESGVVGADGKYPDQPTGMAPLAVDWNLFVKTEPDPTGPKWKYC